MTSGDGGAECGDGVALLAGEACFCDLADEFDMPQSSLSHHLKILVRAPFRDDSSGTPRPDCE